MKKDFSSKWKSSKQPRKQRKYQYNAPTHIKGKFLSAPVAKSLVEKYSIRKIRIREGDKVKILTGSFKGKEGIIESVNVGKSKVMISGIEITKKDGSKTRPMIHASNVLITELKADDKKRLAIKKTEKNTEKAQKTKNKIDAKN